MRSAVFSARMVRVLALAMPCLLPLLSGCELESYPTDLAYPLRSDPIIVTPPGATTWDTFGPGQLDRHITLVTEMSDAKTLDPAKLKPEERRDLDRALRDIFGTPAEPKVELEDAEEEINDIIKDLKLDSDTLKKGSIVYRRHCMHCHGVTGDGRGPTGPWVNPTPRDYRHGSFKFISTDVAVPNRKPRREDIRRTLERGIDGTSMPSFSLLQEEEKEHLISYVMHLSLRGEVEQSTMRPLLDGTGLPDTVGEKVEDLLADSRVGLLQAWAQSNQKGIVPNEYPYKEDGSDEARKQLQESITRGYKLFSDPKGAASCINCHVDFGRQAPFRYDRWGTLVRPANLTAGVFRGGRRPLDIYYRIRGGVEPSQMPRVDFEHEADYWDLVNFIQALPYPQMLPKEISDEIYGTRPEKGEERAQR